MAKSLTAKVGAYSSVVGGGVHIHEPDGRFAGQVAFMCQTDTLRDKALQMAMSEVIANALNELFAARQAPSAESASAASPALTTGENDD